MIRYNVDFEIEDKDGDRAIHHAAFGNEPKVIELLSTALPLKCDLNARNKRQQTALHIGVNKTHTEVVEILLRLGAHSSLQDSDGDTPIHDAITKKCDQIVELLLNYNSDLTVSNNNGFNPIHHAALRGNLSSTCLIVKKLIEQQKLWLINEQKDDGFTALHLSCLNNHYDVAKCLIELGNANLNLKNLNQQTPLQLAIERQHVNMIKLLIDHKANLNEQNKEGDTPLHCLLRNYNMIQLKQMFMQQHQDTCNNSSNEQVTKIDRTTILNLAVMLITNGASLNIKNKKHQTPIDLCSDSNLTKVLIQKYRDNLEVDSSKVLNLVEKQTIKNQIEECMVCSDNKREILFKPCNHLVACSQCANRCKKCLICKEPIEQQIQIDECIVCTDRKASYLFIPCGHACACEVCAVLMKKCVKCRVQIEKQISFEELCSIKQEKSTSNSCKDESVTSLANDNSIGTTDMVKLQQQLQDIKDQVCILNLLYFT